MTEVISQRGGTEFIKILNKIWLGNRSQEIEALTSHLTDKQNRPLHGFDLYMYAEDTPVNEHNKSMVGQLEITVVLIPYNWWYSKRPWTNYWRPWRSYEWKTQWHWKSCRITTSRNWEPNNANSGYKNWWKISICSVGQVMQFRYSNDQIKTVYVECDDLEVGKTHCKKILLEEPTLGFLKESIKLSLV